VNPLLIGSILQMGESLLDRFFPDPTSRAAAQLELLKMTQAGEFKEIDAALSRDLAQAKINEVEASSSNGLISGWRPAAGWICVAGLAYQFLFRPLAPWIITISGHPVPDLPSLEGSLMELTFAMLGIAGLRSFDKKKIVDAKVQTINQ